MHTPTSHTHTPTPAASFPLRSTPKQFDLTAAQHFDGSHARVPMYLSTYHHTQMRDSATRLHPALLRSSLEMPSQPAASMHSGLERRPCPVQPHPGPASPIQTLLLLCDGYGCQPNPTHTKPCPVHASVAVHIIDDAARSRLPHWHIGTPEPHQTQPHLDSPHVARLQLAITS